MNNELRRRAAFWRNMEYSVDQMLEEVLSRSGDKWFDETDAEYCTSLSQHLGSALKTIRERFCEVLEDQVNEFMSNNKSGGVSYGI